MCLLARIIYVVSSPIQLAHCPLWSNLYCSSTVPVPDPCIPCKRQKLKAKCQYKPTNEHNMQHGMVMKEKRKMCSSLVQRYDHMYDLCKMSYITHNISTYAVVSTCQTKQVVFCRTGCFASLENDVQPAHIEYSEWDPVLISRNKYVHI